MLPDPLVLLVTRVQDVNGAKYAWLRPLRPCKVGKLLSPQVEAAELAPGLLVVFNHHALEPQVPAVIRLDPAADPAAADQQTVGTFAFLGPGLPTTRNLGHLAEWLRAG